MLTPALSPRHAAFFCSAALALCQPHSASAQPWAEEDLESPSEVFCLASGDLDGNLRTDLVAGTPDRTVLVYLNSPGGLELAQTVQINDDAMALAVADLDGDGDKDILYGTRDTVEGGWIPNQGGVCSGRPSRCSPPSTGPCGCRPRTSTTTATGTSSITRGQATSR